MRDVDISELVVGDFVELYRDRIFYIRSSGVSITYHSGTKAEVVGVDFPVDIDIKFMDGNIAYACDTGGLSKVLRYNHGEEPLDVKAWATKRQR